jgi:two-component system, chemotaxis family, protein-glutamate methylesterase/glutaminase
VKPALKLEDFRLKWADVSVIPDGWSADARDWALLHWKTSTGERVSSLRLEDINQEYRLKLYRRLQELKTSGDVGTWTFYISPAFRSRVDDLLDGEFSRYFEVLQGPRLRISKKASRLHFQQKIRVMTVDDSRTMQVLISKALLQSSQFEIVDQVTDPLKVMDQVRVLDPDVLTLDIHMPGKNGVEVLRDLMRELPRPAVLLTSLSKEDGTLVFEGLAAGAFEYLQKPSHEDLEQFAQSLEVTLLSAFEAREKVSNSTKERALRRVARTTRQDRGPKEELILIGSSTGGTQALSRVLPLLPKDSPPVVIVQHIPAVFSRALAESLNRVSEIEVVEAEDGMLAEAGRAYIAPGGLQLALERREGKLALRLRDDAPVNRFKPSVDYMFQTAVQVSGLKISAALLTGMGRDGAQGLLGLKSAGAWTIAQDEETSVVYGMPRAAKELGAECEVIALDQVAEALLSGLSRTR